MPKSPSKIDQEADVVKPAPVEPAPSPKPKRDYIDPNRDKLLHDVEDEIDKK